MVLVQAKTEILDAWKSHPTLPLSLLSAARKVARERNVVLVDERVDREWRATLAQLLARRPICVAITSVTGRQLLHALAIARAVREISPTTPVVWGGIHGTLLPEQTLAGGLVDVVVIGEGETTFAELVEAFAAGRPAWEVPGTASLDDEGAVRLGPPRGKLDLDRLDPIPYHLAGPGYLFLRGGRQTAYFETSRGCPYPCGYCYTNSLFGVSWRGQSAATVLEHLRHLRASLPGVSHVSITDDSYFTRTERALEIAEGILREGWDITYQVQGTVIPILKKLSDDELALLRRSGMVRVDMGVESGSERIQREIGKGLKIADVREINRRLAKHDIVPWYNFMSGFPEESASEFAATLDLLLEVVRENPQALVSPVYCLAPYPGTDAYHIAARAGFQFPPRTEDWARFALDRSNNPWMTESQRKAQEAAYFLSIFVDGKVREYGTWPLRVLAALYRPIAKLRLARRWFRFLPEKWLADRVTAASC
ncbi:MAG: radical SAM protein [bacterium]